MVNANRVLSREHTGQSKHSFPTTQEMACHHQMVSTKIILIIFFIAENGEVLHSQQKQDLERIVAKIMCELLIVKFILKLKKVGETTKPFRYDLKQIPYDYSVEVMNRFKGLDLVDRGMDGGLKHCTGVSGQNHPKEKEMQEDKVVV